MNKKTKHLFFLPLIFVMLISLACKFGSVSIPESNSTPDQSQNEGANPTQEPEESANQSPGPVSGVDDLKKAVVVVKSQSTFRSLSDGWRRNVDLRATGFLIDPSGIILTTNTVLDGVSTVRAQLADEKEDRTARVLAGSECDGFAMIKIDGDNFPYLNWYEGEIKEGMDVFSAGYPYSSTGMDYSVTKGIVSKSSGSTNWSDLSLSQVVEHTATINSGSLGGPLVDLNGRVLGINLGFNEARNQNYAVHRDAALKVVEQMKNKIRVNSLGINGLMVDTDLQGFNVSGLWVDAVVSGSPADKVRILPGDVITEIGNKRLVNLDLGSYCEVVRSHDITEPISVVLFRPDTLEMLTGQFNGRELELTESLAPTPVTAANTAPEVAPTAANNPPPETNNDQDLLHYFGLDAAYFITDFDNSQDLSSYADPDDANYDAEVNNGKLHLSVWDPHTTVFVLHDQIIEDENVSIESSVELVGGPIVNNISLICRAGEDGWYEFSITGDGGWYIYRYQDNKYEVLANGVDDAINSDYAINSLNATCVDNSLSFSVNGIWVGSASDDVFIRGGQVGVSVTSFDDPNLEVEFDYLFATED